MGSPCISEEAKSRWEGSQSSGGADDMPPAPPLALGSSTSRQLELPVVPMTQAYAWPGLADIFLRLVLRLPGCTGQVEMKGIKAALRGGSSVPKRPKSVDKQGPEPSDVSLFCIP